MYHSNSSKNLQLFSANSCVNATPSSLSELPIEGIDCNEGIVGIPPQATALSTASPRTPYGVAE
jgi:hypothetical protein